MTHQEPQPSGVLVWCCGLAVLLATVLASPWQLTDPDALSRLAIGRTIVTGGQVPDHDPLTFSAPTARWSNPEWLGDTLWYATFRALGEPGLQALKLLLVAGGMLLAWSLARALGAAAVMAAALLLLMLPGEVARFTVRNQIHLLWLVPAYGLLLRRAEQRPALALATLLLGALWANLHASFPLAWVLLLAAALDAWRRGAWRLALLTGVSLLLHPLLPLLGPQGLAAYGQVWDHLRHGAVYRQLILEWHPGGPVAALAGLPLHLMAVVGLLSFLPRANRRQLGGFVLLVAGLALAYSSRRFLPALAVLAAPPVAANLTRVLAPLRARRRRLLMAASLLLALLAALVAMQRVRSAPPPHLLQRNDAPLAAARLLAQQAPRGTRLFNPYNAGPWLLWICGQRVQLYIDPRNNLGARHLQRYLDQLLPSPAAFEREVQRLTVDLALVDLSDGRYGRLAAHLARARQRWRLVHTDGRFALYGRAGPPLAEGAYDLLRGTLDLGYLAPHLRRADSRLAADLRRLRRQSAPLADAVQALGLLVQDGPISPAAQRPAREPDARARARRARQLLSRALPQLPPSAALMGYLAAAHARLGEHQAAAEIRRTIRALFGGS